MKVNNKTFLLLSKMNFVVAIFCCLTVLIIIRLASCSFIYTKHPSFYMTQQQQQLFQSMPRATPTFFTKTLAGPFLTHLHNNNDGLSDNNINNINDSVIKKQKYNVSIVLIDHYDSFTYNLYDMIAQLTESPPLVIAKDAFDSWSDFERQRQQQDYGISSFDGIILSPGPGSPQEQPFLSKTAILDNPNLPILGVCLGHQLLAQLYGANVTTAPLPIHGQQWNISTTTTTNNNTLFQNLPHTFQAVRYHSLMATPATIPNCLKITATSKNDNVIQGLEHVYFPHYGVQFHPESIGTQHGLQLLENFIQSCQQYKDRNENLKSANAQKIVINKQLPTMNNQELETLQINNGNNNKNFDKNKNSTDNTINYQVYMYQLPNNLYPEPQQVFDEFYSHQPYSIWLDSSSSSSSSSSTNDIDNNNDKSNNKDYNSFKKKNNVGTISIMAASNKPEWKFEYHMKRPQHGNNNNNTKNDHPTIMSWLKQKLQGPTTMTTSVKWMSNDLQTFTTINEDSLNVPFEYRGGLLGFIGYEVRHDTTRYLQQQESGRCITPPQQHSCNGGTMKRNYGTQKSIATTTTRNNNDVPSAAFFLADKSMVYDHPTQQWYLIGVTTNDSEQDEILNWMQMTTNRMEQLCMQIQSPSLSLSSLSSTQKKLKLPRNNYHRRLQLQHQRSSSLSSKASLLKFRPNRSRFTYEQNIAQCKEYIRLGESYELCLTNQLEATVSSKSDPLNLYHILRRRNPAPYSAFFRWGLTTNNNLGRKSDGEKNTINFNDLAKTTSFAICCSSPERFLSIRRQKDGTRQAEAKPIKGTSARVLPKYNGSNTSLLSSSLTRLEQIEDDRRAIELQQSVKNKAENLMIVDLLRNDMSRVCQIGSVHVSKLMDIESYATVHQMVSTIRGTVRNDKTAVDLLQACFPGGSMTGAPKVRTMELLEELENGVDRGPYSGCLGYISLNGSMDMNIIIRTAVVTPKNNNINNNKEYYHNNGYKVKIGAGGAITALSDTKDEYEEMMLKARAIVQAVEEWANTAKTNPALSATEFNINRELLERKNETISSHSLPTRQV